MFPERAWKSKKHDTGDMFDGMFIVGIETDEGQATYHYDIDPYWDMFEVNELDFAPKWDGHTPEDAIKRISTLHMTGNTSSWVFEGRPIHCKACGFTPDYSLNKENSRRCPGCGKEMK
jgi:predicted Zn-ribbon and HTH transcriptional regulator